MVKRRKDPVREDRIENEAIVDASPEEQAMGWYYYLENKICFPFPAKCIATKVVSPLRKGEAAEVIRMAPEDNCAHDMFVLVRWQGRKMTVPLSQLGKQLVQHVDVCSGIHFPGNGLVECYNGIPHYPARM